jgi:hypothetical protein
MTFDDDFLVILTESGVRRLTCRSLAIEWPPPETINILSFIYRRQRMSEISDEARAQMTHVCRGAEYALDSVERL